MKLFCPRQKCYYWSHESRRYGRKCYYEYGCWRGDLDNLLAIFGLAFDLCLMRILRKKTLEEL